MSHSIPVVVSSAPDRQVGELIAEIFFVTPDGRIAKELERTPVQNGVAVYHGPTPEPGLLFAVRIRQSDGIAVFRSGPLRRLPGPPSPVVATSAIRLHIDGFGFSLSNKGSDGVPEILTQELQNLPPPLQFQRVEQSAGQGNYVLTVFGRMRIFFALLPFSYQRAFQLSPNSEPGQLSPVVFAQPIGQPVVRGPFLLPYEAVLDIMLRRAIERQLDVALAGLASLTVEFRHAGFHVQTVSVGGLSVGGRPPLIDMQVGTMGAGAITGLTNVIHTAAVK